MSTFIVVFVVGASTWVVFRAATQPVEPATAGAGPTRAPAPREERAPKRRPAPRPVTPPPIAPEVLAPPSILPPPVVAAPPLEEDVTLEELEPGPLDEPAELDDEELEDEELVVVATPPRIRRGPRSDPGEPSRRPNVVSRARSAIVLVALATVLGAALAIAIGLGALVLFNVLRSALG